MVFRGLIVVKTRPRGRGSAKCRVQREKDPYLDLKLPFIEGFLCWVELFGFGSDSFPQFLDSDSDSAASLRGSIGFFAWARPSIDSFTLRSLPAVHNARWSLFVSSSARLQLAE